VLLGLGTEFTVQAQETPLSRPDPVEIPIGTEARAPIPELPTTTSRRLPPKSIILKFGTWNLTATKPGELDAAQQKPEKPKKKWRNTFGSERTTAHWRSFAKGGLAVDLVALQGVKNIRTASRLFNARRFHIVTSRQLLARSTANSTGFAVFRADAPATTALAFRRRRGVRVWGFRHFLPRTIRQGAEPPAITAFRLRIYRKTLWVASADTPTKCTTDRSAAICQNQATILNNFVTWVGKQLAKRKTPLLLLGRWPDTIAEKLKEVGYEVHATIGNTVTCTPKPSPSRLFGPVARTSDAATMANANVPKSNPCAATADLTLNLQ